MNVLVTGGKRFIARSLAEGLGASYKISAPPRQELDLLDAEKTAAYLKAGKFDAVLHCATYDAAPKTSTKDPAKVLENNLRMFFNIARSSGEFGRENWKPRMREDYFDVHVPSDQYGLSKHMIWTCCRTYSA